MTFSERCLMSFEHLTLHCFLFLSHSGPSSLPHNFPLPLLSFPSSLQRILLGSFTRVWEKD